MTLRNGFISTMLLAGLGLGSILFPPSPAAAGADCADLRLSLDPGLYDLSCDEDQQQVIDAVARDGSHFLLIVDAVAEPHMVFGTDVSLRNLMQEVLNLNVRQWKSARAVEEISQTAAFTTDIKGIVSSCLGFRVDASRYGPGWRRLVLGVACSREGGLEPLYRALEAIDFPG